MARLAELEVLIAPIAQALGYALVRVRISAARRPVLQIMAERADGLMDVEDCARLSRAISEALEADDPIEGEYVLEVSSPGIDRPLTRRRDYEDYRGHEARITLAAAIGGRKKFKGTLRGLEGEDVIIETEMQDGHERATLRLPFMAIEEGRLVLTDALIAEDLKRRKQAQTNAQSQTEEPQSHGRKRQ